MLESRLTKLIFFRSEVSAQGVKWKSLSKENESQLVSCPLTGKTYTYNIMVSVNTA